MSQNTYKETLGKIKDLQDQLEHEFDQLLSEKRAQFKYRLKKGRVIFEKEISELHKKHRIDVWTYIKNSNPLYILTSPIIYGVIIPLVLLDAAVFIYQQICFRVYRIPIVKRADYIVIDRHNLDYLNAIEKFNCMYCGYGNGLIEYIREIFARTEQYWCPIKHARHARNRHPYVENFVDYGDAENYKSCLHMLRKQLNESQDKS